MSSVAMAGLAGCAGFAVRVSRGSIGFHWPALTSAGVIQRPTSTPSPSVPSFLEYRRLRMTAPNCLPLNCSHWSR